MRLHVLETLPDTLAVTHMARGRVEEDKEGVHLRRVRHCLREVNHLLHFAFPKHRGALFKFLNDKAVSFALKEFLSEVLVLIAGDIVPAAGSNNQEHHDTHDHVDPILFHYKFSNDNLYN